MTASAPESERDPASPGAGRTPAAAPALPRPSLVACLAAGLAATALASTGFALLELLAGMLLTPVETYEETWPIWLVAAAAGRAIVTYFLLLLGPLLAAALAYAAWLRRPGTSSAPWLVCAACLCVTFFILPLDLEIARSADWVSVALVWSIGIVASLSIYAIGRACAGRLGAARFSRVFGVGTAAVGALAALFAVVFMRSPLLDADGYRAPRGRAPAAAQPASPHVLLIVLDTVRADRLGPYGHERPTTPFLDSLAKRAIVFENAIANGMWTVPTHASMLTGLPARTHGVGHVTIRLDDAFETLPEVFGRHGYATACFSNNPLISPATNMSQGFDRSVVPQEFQRVSRFAIEHWIESRGITPPVTWFDADYGGAITSAFVAEWLDETAGRPTFMLVNYMAAHLPYRVPIRYRRMFMSEENVQHSYDLRQSLYGDIEHTLNVDANIDGDAFLTDQDRETLVLQYEAAIRMLDDRLQDLFDLYASRGMLENTIVAITSDHGEYLGTKGMWSHHFQLYQDLIHVPLILQTPRRTEGIRCSALVQQTDLYATLVRAALGAEAAPAGGRDLVAIAERGETGGTAIAECYEPDPHSRERLRQLDDPELRRRACAQTAVIEDSFKYVTSSDGHRELFDLSRDPGETVNLASTDPQRVMKLQRALDAWLRVTPAYRRQQGESQMSPELLQKLRALGYIGDDGS